MKIKSVDEMQIHHRSDLESDDINKKFTGAQRDYASLANKWFNRYNKTKRPVPVNFSKITPHYFIKDRATHLIHFYPAKLTSQIPEFFVRALSQAGDYVFDPFAGSGTVPLETILAGRRPLAAELNPLARLITRVKTTPLPVELLETEAERLLQSIDLRKHSVRYIPANLIFWHSPRVLRQLSAIANALHEWSPACERGHRNAVKIFFIIVFSSIIRKKSLADPKIAPPVKLKPAKFKADRKRYEETRAMLAAKKKADCIEIFRRAIEEGIKRVASLHDQVGESVEPCLFLAADARKIPVERSLPVNLIVTSPPYIAAQKYVRSTSLELFWLGFLKNSKERSAIEHLMVGSELPRLQRGQACPKTNNLSVDRIIKLLWSKNRGRAKVVANYFDDMFTILRRLYDILVPGGFIVLVVGNNTVCGRTIPVARILRNHCISLLGFTCHAVLADKIRSYGLMTKRNHTSGIITHEYILVMQKPIISN